ncbi:MAG: hypothetical protein ACD_20C00434G0005 [uncultured bacterium]|nr:MAG: hypothetical protein ACD_20C00434G0005 [uncultured bacterium]
MICNFLLEKRKKILMKVLYDPQIFFCQKYGGISRYYFEIINYFYENSEFDITFPLLYSDNHYLEKAVFSRHKQFLASKKLDNIQYPRKVFYKIYNNAVNKINKKFRSNNRSFVKESLEKQNFDLLHPTYYDPCFLQYLDKKPFVLTIYDMIQEKFPEGFTGDLASMHKKKLAQKADKIIAISENTKKDIIKFYGIDENKIEVTYLANSFDINKVQSQQDIKLPEHYILFVGTRGLYKNFKGFIKSIIPLLNQDNDLKVVSAGGAPFNQEEATYLEGLGIKEQVLYCPVADETLPYFYKNAKAFIFPSLYEGFGIPVLEAFSCGCPLIVSNTSSLPEVAGDAAVYMDPKNEDSILESIKSVIYNNSLRQELINKGYNQVKKFSWQKTAQETKKVYESIL